METQRARQWPVERRQRNGPVSQHLDSSAALTEQDHRAKNAVDSRTDDQLLSMGTAVHIIRTGKIEHDTTRMQVTPDSSPDAGRALRSSDHGNRGRIEQLIEVADAHREVMKRMASGQPST